METTKGPRLRTAINAHLLSGEAGYRSAGVHQYIYHLLRHVGEVDPDVVCTALLGEGRIPAGASVQEVRSRLPTGRASVRVLWEQLVQPLVLRRIEADLVHAPAFVGPLIAPCPVVVTIHDLSFIRFPRLFRPANRLYLRTFTRLSARRARRFIAVSAHAAEETHRLLDVPRERIDVVYHGVEPRFYPYPPEEVEAFRKRKGLPKSFVLFVGTLEPRKNLERLVRAFARAKVQEAKLVLVGGKGWLYDRLFEAVTELGLQDDVIFAGYVAGDELPLWYNAAVMVAYPSIYEGFGLPVLEAQACGIPVLTSTASSLPEAAGQAGLLVDPEDVDAIADGLCRLLEDDALRDELRAKGLAHAKGFTWESTVEETVSVYHRALVGGGA